MKDSEASENKNISDIGENLSQNIDEQSITIKTEIFNDLESNDENFEIKSEPLIDSNQNANIFNVNLCQRTSSKNMNFQSKLNGNSIVNKTTKFFNESKADDSQDSLFQTMEDMFCESDDSSDLTTLIEKHSSNLENSNSQTQEVDLEGSKSDEKKLRLQENKRKRSNSNSFKVKKRSVRNSPIGFNDLKSAKYRKKVNEIWLVERVHQSSRLKSTMLEMSLLNYRKYGRIKNKFIALFGESDDEEGLPESPVCIEEHLQACKERIAPWIVKHLTPFYNQKRISSRELFKTICRHITDMLIINNTFPGGYFFFMKREKDFLNNLI